MPISDKIIREIESLKVKPEVKRLLVDALEIEDEGVFQYKAKYEHLIKTYLESGSKGEKK